MNPLYELVFIPNSLSFFTKFKGFSLTGIKYNPKLYLIKAFVLLKNNLFENKAKTPVDLI